MVAKCLYSFYCRCVVLPGIQPQSQSNWGRERSSTKIDNRDARESKPLPVCTLKSLCGIPFISNKLKETHLNSHVLSTSPTNRLQAVRLPPVPDKDVRHVKEHLVPRTSRPCLLAKRAHKGGALYDTASHRHHDHLTRSIGLNRCNQNNSDIPTALLSHHSRVLGRKGSNKLCKLPPIIERKNVTDHNVTAEQSQQTSGAYKIQSNTHTALESARHRQIIGTNREQIMAIEGKTLIPESECELTTQDDIVRQYQRTTHTTRTASRRLFTLPPIEPVKIRPSELMIIQRQNLQEYRFHKLEKATYSVDVVPSLHNQTLLNKCEMKPHKWPRTKKLHVHLPEVIGVSTLNPPNTAESSFQQITKYVSDNLANYNGIKKVMLLPEDDADKDWLNGYDPNDVQSETSDKSLGKISDWFPIL